MSPRLVLALPWALAAVAVALFAAWSVRPAPLRELRARVAASEALSAGSTEGFERALEPRTFSFPRDHGPHEGFRTEWWYFTGNLDGEGGERFGYELTFFRVALAPRAEERSSRWATTHAWMAHFALTDVDGKRFAAFERIEREALDLAGATPAGATSTSARSDPWRVWTRDWSAASTASGARHLSASHGDFAIELDLTETKPPALQGERGLSRKSAEPGNASYYYSLTRLATSGNVRIGERTFAVRGSSWMDREWSTSALASDQEGWDWFALELDDQRELMLYRLRRKDGTLDPFSQGSLIAADGSVTPITKDEASIEVLGHWTSPRSGIKYPSRWRIRVPKLDLALDAEPLLADQELDLTVRYWEGAVAVKGTSNGAAFESRGYVELVGY